MRLEALAAILSIGLALAAVDLAQADKTSPEKAETPVVTKKPPASAQKKSGESWQGYFRRFTSTRAGGSESKPLVIGTKLWSYRQP